jgi:hypothetical protein
MNSDELARNKFNALFAAHDAKDRPAAVQQPPALETAPKSATKKVKPPMSTDQGNARSFD